MTTAAPPVIVWFRRDLRLADNPALAEAAASGRPVIPVYLHDPEAAGAWSDGAASRWWLHHALGALAEALDRAGAPLLRLRGPAGPVLADLAAATGAEQVLWNRRIEPWAVRQEAEVCRRLAGRGIGCRSFLASLLFEPGSILNRAGAPFKVFTPFWRACLAAPPPPRPLPAPARLRPAAALPGSEALAAWRLLPTAPDWSAGLRRTWQPGEDAALRRLAGFLDDTLLEYGQGRDRPGRDQTSRLSPHLQFGELSPRQLFHATAGAGPSAGAERFLAELGWREFSAHLLHQHPDLPERPLRPEFEGMAWRCDSEALEAWRHGRTGYPLVDAGMRQLWATGWMHNRVRMVAASFLVKDLLISWREGEAWFWDTLVDADLASNAASWQWVAGCGADASPFFRVFNPVLQGEKFDADGAYVRHWCPELAALPDRWLHQPWRAPAETLRRAGVTPGQSCPAPLVAHDESRRRALAAFAALKGARQSRGTADPGDDKTAKDDE
ncbi:MAG: deoxyribodipyrimidine photo-lyase [Rhodospirillaceae bacterium]